MIVKSYWAIGTVVSAVYLAQAALGWGLDWGTRGSLPASVRQSPGGYRSFHFWHSGYHGGK